ncbi:MAG: hypothetical protein R3F17_11505 [Planctomycetota bacterium]
MEILFALVAIGLALAVVIWLGSGSGSSSNSTPGHIGRKDEQGRTILEDDMREIGNLTGMLGGSIEDAFVARYALRHAKKSSRARQEGSSGDQDPN